MSSSLRSGTTLGSYRIVAPLGAGGMGEVFRAHDSKLDRAVALKILPESVVRDGERVRRFVQEARSASSLSHPNIVTIHDIGQAVPIEEGASEPASDAMLDLDSVQVWSYLLSADGETLFFTKGERSSDAVLIENFQ